MEKLTGKEEEVMEMIWKIGPCAPKDVVAEYEEPKPHINTIATMFQSLERKGISFTRRRDVVTSTLPPLLRKTMDGASSPIS